MNLAKALGLQSTAPPGPGPEQKSIEARVEALEGTMRSLQFEWLDTYDRLLRLVKRLDKRAYDEENRDGGQPDAATLTGDPRRDRRIALRRGIR